MIKIGASWSTKKSSRWDDKGKSDIVRILISHDSYVDSLQFLYADNGKFVLSDLYGTMTADKFAVVDLDYPSEFLTSVSGEYATPDTGCNKVVSAITFGTNKGTYGPYGLPIGGDSNKFDYQLGKQRSFGGFHGSVRYSAVESIGVYIKPFAPPDVEN